jgi:hypothetical protein
VRVENHYVDAKPNNSTRNSTVSFPFNTDGFNLSGQNITVDGYWGENGCAMIHSKPCRRFSDFPASMTVMTVSRS